MKDINLLNDDFTSSATKSDPKSMVSQLIVAVPVLLILAAILVAPLVYDKILTSRVTKINQELVSSRFKEVKSINTAIKEKNMLREKRNTAIREIDLWYFSFDEVYSNLRALLPGPNTILTELNYEINEQRMLAAKLVNQALYDIGTINKNITNSVFLERAEGGIRTNDEGVTDIRLRFSQFPKEAN